ncbi:ABC transporter permease [Cytobacillus purgationiresistens]|uniref:Transport permease protein n=1 Tax=Cytobacillus purgationiresistens TaxID=863449 RepID=A0ABU0AKR3_9BACI|nr:ABC transporter permease [Cytobacillus purgationiresistens]MDQ0271474.1 ABC-2 type transport system permease protein [Cytobacillus purgationiresistens]
MRNIIWLMQNALRVIFKNKKNVLIYIFGPVISVMIAVAAYGDWTGSELRIGVVNEDGGYIANDTVSFFSTIKNVKVEKLDQTEMKDKIISGSVDTVVVFENGFTESIEAGNPKNIQLISIKGAEVTAFIESYLYQYLGNILMISEQIEGKDIGFRKIYDQYKQSSFGVHAHSVEDTSKHSMMTVRTMGFLIIIMFLSAGTLSSMILKEKENRTYFRLIATPITSKQYVTSNTLVNTLFMIFQVILTIVLMTQLFKIELRFPIYEMIIVMSLFAVVTVGGSLCIVAFSKTSSAASAIQNVIITPTCMLSGCFFPIEIMPESVQRLANFFPQKWVLETVSSLQQGAAFTSLYMNYLILAAFALTFFLIAVYKFSRRTDITIFK